MLIHGVWSSVMAGLAGLVLGSFIAALTWRWPRGESIAEGRSACASCGARLNAFDLMPVLGYALLKGRCRQCTAAISSRYPAIELSAGLIGVLSFSLVPLPSALLLAGFGLMMLTLAILDVEHFWLPDRLTLPLLVCGLGLGFWLPPSFADRLIGAGAGYASLALIAYTYRRYRGREGLGAGDAKLFAAIGAWLGWAQLPFVLLAASLLGLLLAGLARLRGKAIAADAALPFGALLAAAAWPLAIVEFAP